MLAALAFFGKCGLQFFEECDEWRIPRYALVAVFPNSGGESPLLEFHGEPGDQTTPALSFNYSRRILPSDDGVDRCFQNAGDAPERNRG